MSAPNFSNLLMSESTLRDIEDEANYYRKSPNIKFLPCGLSFIKNTTGYGSVGSIVFGWAYATYFVPTIILWPRYNEDHIGLAPFIFFYAFSTLTIVSLFRASMSDPGWVPFDVKSTSPDKLNWSHCGRCLVERPVKSHHCSKCQRCVRKMDHHCHWINNCVAEDNQWLFLLLVLYGSLLSAYTLMLLVLHFYYFPECTLCDKTSFVQYYSRFIMYWQFLQGLVLLAICSSQLFVQSGNILMNKTTVESIINQNNPDYISKLILCTNLFVALYRPVNKSARALFQEVCGDGLVLCWFNPFRRRRMRPQIYYPQEHV